MTFPQGIQFRSTAGYVTDGANIDPEVAITANYPRTTAQGNSVGWEQAAAYKENSSTTNDHRLAGHQEAHGTAGTINYRIDLPATGDYKITWASGQVTDFGNSYAVNLYDTSTLLASLGSGTQSAVDRYSDATAVVRTSSSDWATNNATVTKTFSSTILRLQNNASVFVMYTYIMVEAASSAVTAALSGQSASWSAGSVSPASSKALSGSAGTFSQGSVTAGQSLSGQASTFAAGTLSPASSKALTGSSSTASAGTIIPATSLALSGNAATYSAGTLTPAVSAALTGIGLTWAQGSLTVPGDITIALSGQVITISQGTLTAAVSGEQVSGGGTSKKRRRRKPLTWAEAELMREQEQRVPIIEPVTEPPAPVEIEDEEDDVLIQALTSLLIH